MPEPLSYEKAGVNIANADDTKKQMAAHMKTGAGGILHKPGAFASLVDARFEEYRHPLLVLKTEEPGSKQKIAFAHGRPQSICLDMINHLINDIIVAGAKPLVVQDCIVCGQLEKGTVLAIVEGISQACRAQGCELIGGETSEQPGVVQAGTYILSASIVGVVEKDKLIDGGKIALGDVVLAVPSNGVHTNGYTLVRALLAQDAGLAESKLASGETFLEAILRPHYCYFQAFKGLFDWPELHGLAHITGGGVAGNLNRILPAGMDAACDLAAFRPLEVFKLIRHAGNVPDDDMLRTFNMGVGMALVCAPAAAEKVVGHLAGFNLAAYEIGRIVPGGQEVRYRNKIKW